MRACVRARMGAEKITTEDALDLLAPSDDALSTEDAIAATRAPTDSGPTLSEICLLYTSPSPRDGLLSRMPSSA